MSTDKELDRLAATPVDTPLGAEVWGPVIQRAPFIPSTSIMNLRDIGAVPGAVIRPGRFYRSAILEYAPKDPSAMAWMTANVKRIFDIRHADEALKQPDPKFEGVENVQLPWPSRPGGIQAADFVTNGGADGWKKEHLEVMKMYGPVYREVLVHVRDRPQEPVLFHCAAGRDRTGIMAGLLHILAGTPREVVIRDYMLSRIGTEPARDKLLAYALQTVNSSPELHAEPDKWPAGFVNLVSLRPEFWDGAEEGVKEAYGDWDGYVTKELGFSEEDLEKIKKNLRD